MQINFFISNAKEFGYELVKAVAKQTLVMSPLYIGSRVSHLVGYEAPFNFLLGRFSNIALVGIGLHSALKLAGRVSVPNPSLASKSRDILNVLTGMVIMTHATNPTELTAYALYSTLALGAIANLYSGIKEINSGMRTQSGHYDWKQVSAGIVSVGVVMLIYQKAIFQGLNFIRNAISGPTRSDEIDKNMAGSVESIQGQSNVYKPKYRSLPDGWDTYIKKTDCVIDKDLAGTVLSIKGQCDLSQSKVVFVSDNHDENIMDVARQKLLSSLMKDGDILLLEGHPILPKHLEYKAHFIKPDIVVMGWDSKELHAFAQKNAHRIDELAGQLLAKQSSGEILENNSELVKEFKELDASYYTWTIGKRNAFMTEKISSLLPSLTGNQQVFVIAGETHLENKLLNQFEGQHTALFLKWKPYVDAQTLREYFASRDAVTLKLNLFENYLKARQQGTTTEKKEVKAKDER